MDTRDKRHRAREQRLPSTYVLCLALAATLPLGAQAAEFAIAAGDSAGLIAAINQANATPAPDAIQLAAGNYVLTDCTEDEPGVDPEYFCRGLPGITSPVTIYGASLSGTGQHQTSIERPIVGGTHDFRLVSVDAGGEAHHASGRVDRG